MIDPTRVMRKNTKEPLKFLGCEGPHLRRYCQLPSTQEAETVGQEPWIIPKICAVLEDHQEGHNSTVVEFEGEIAKQTISVLIDPGSTHIYITLGLVEMCTLKKSKHRISWLF